MVSTSARFKDCSSIGIDSYTFFIIFFNNVLELHFFFAFVSFVAVKQAHGFEPREECALEFELLQFALPGFLGRGEDMDVDFADKFHTRNAVGVIIVVHRFE